MDIRKQIDSDPAASPQDDTILSAANNPLGMPQDEVILSAAKNLRPKKFRTPHLFEYKRMIKWMFISTLLTNCGDQGGFLTDPPHRSQPVVTISTADQLKNHEVVEGSYLVMFRGDNSVQSTNFATFLDEYQYHYLSLQDDFLADPRLKDIDVLTSVDLSRKASAQWSPDFDAPQLLQLFWQKDAAQSGVIAKVDFHNETDAKDVLQEWQQKGRIWYAEPNGRSYLAVASAFDTYKDNYTSMDIWWHKNIKLPEAFNDIAALTARRSDSEIAASPPIIAVLDSGLDYDHPAIKSALWVNSAPGASGCVNDINGCNTTAPEKGSLGNGDIWPAGTTGPGQAVPKKSKGSHGTHVSGIIAATPDTSRNIGGVCPVCKIMTVKVAEIESSSNNADPSIRDDSQIRALKYVSRFKNKNDSAIRIVNSSFGKYARSRSVATLVDVLKKVGSGTLVIAAASNEDSMIRSYPAALSNSIAVAGLRQDSQKARYSNFGPWVDIAAPGGAGTGDDGDQITSTVPGDQTAGSSGTSMAAPVVAGAAGLYLALFPNVDINTLRSKITDTADGSIYYADTEAAKFNSSNYFPQIAGEQSRRPLLGSGILDVQNMIADKPSRRAIGAPVDRVTAGCGMIQHSDYLPKYSVVLYLLLLFPLFAYCINFGFKRWVLFIPQWQERCHPEAKPKDLEIRDVSLR